MNQFNYIAPNKDFLPQEILDRAGLKEQDSAMESIKVLNEVFTFYFAHYPIVIGVPTDGTFHDMWGVCDRLAGLIYESQRYFANEEKKE